MLGRRANARAKNYKRRYTMDLERFNEQVFFATVRITLSDQTGTNSSIGTGFLVKFPLTKYPGKALLLLISNKHVYNNPKKRIVLTFHKKDKENKPSLSEFAVFDKIDFTGIYFEHPDPKVDLACINVSFLEIPENNIYIRNIPPELFIDFSHKDFLPGSDIWFIGYPDNRFDTEHNLPILRRGYIASIPKIDFNGNKQFVIDAQVFPGSSGSPVFVPIDGQFRFCGVIAQTMIKNEMLQSIPASVAYGIQQTIGLGLVIKSELVKELIDYIDKTIKIA